MAKKHQIVIEAEKEIERLNKKIRGVDQEKANLVAERNAFFNLIDWHQNISRSLHDKRKNPTKSSTNKT